MRLLRFYVPFQLTEGQRYILPDNVFRHAVKVLRLAVNAELTLFTGDNKEYRAKLTSVAKKRAEIEILGSSYVSRESKLKIHLVQGISKGDRMDFVLQKATELGVSSVSPVFSERTNVLVSPERVEKKLDHWRGVVISACEQCGRNVLPYVFPPQQLSSALTHFSEQQKMVKYVLSPAAASGLSLLDNKHLESAVLIGPEGGFSNEELQLASVSGFTEVSLGPRILRTETAALSFLAIAQGICGDLT